MFALNPKIYSMGHSSIPCNLSDAVQKQSKIITYPSVSKSHHFCVWFRTQRFIITVKLQRLPETKGEKILSLFVKACQKTLHLEGKKTTTTFRHHFHTVQAIHVLGDGGGENGEYLYETTTCKQQLPSLVDNKSDRDYKS